ncbi:MAG TPA: hypothetical protein VFU22_11200, partial [Roseiflexaceae bacterium]|nr:hypothetical protein [Roseiflexaceae bacterium]
MLALRALVAWYRWDRRQAFAHAKAALPLLPEDNVQWRGISMVYVGVEELLDGRLHAARQTLLRAREFCTTAGNIPGTQDAIILLGRVALGQGTLRQAAELFQQVLAA